MDEPVAPMGDQFENTPTVEASVVSPNKSYWRRFKEYFFPEETKDDSTSTLKGNSYWNWMRSWLGYASPSKDSLAERETDTDTSTEDDDFEDSMEEASSAKSFWSWLKWSSSHQDTPEERFERHFNACAKQLTSNNCDKTALLHALSQLLKQFPQNTPRIMILFDQLGDQLVDTAEDVIYGSFIDDQSSEDLIAFLYSVDAFLAYAETFPAIKDTPSYIKLDRLIHGSLQDWYTAISYVGGLDMDLSFHIMHSFQRAFSSPQMKRLIASVINIYTQIFSGMFPWNQTL